MKLSLIVAIGTEGCIGVKGGLPWQCKDDMRHFRKVTMGKHVVMGRKTWESLPTPKLPGRQCIVVTSQPLDSPDAIVVGSFAEAKAAALQAGSPELMIIGGKRLFEEHYDECDTLYITTIYEEITGADTFFNFDLKPHRWRLLDTDVREECCFYRWVRR